MRENESLRPRWEGTSHEVHGCRSVAGSSAEQLAPRKCGLWLDEVTTRTIFKKARSH